MSHNTNNNTRFDELKKKFEDPHGKLTGATDQEMDQLVVILATAVEKYGGKLVADQPASTRSTVNMTLGEIPRARNKITKRQAQLLVTNKYIQAFANIKNLANPRVVYEISDLGRRLLETPRAEAPQGVHLSRADQAKTDAWLNSLSGPSAVAVIPEPTETLITSDPVQESEEQKWAKVRAIYERALTPEELIHPSQEEAFWHVIRTTYGASLVSHMLSFAALEAFTDLKTRALQQYEKDMKLVRDLIIDPLTDNLPRPTEVEANV